MRKRGLQNQATSTKIEVPESDVPAKRCQFWNYGKGPIGLPQEFENIYKTRKMHAAYKISCSAREKVVLLKELKLEDL